eukprot:g1144.t1
MSDSDDEDSLFPNVRIVQAQAREPYRPPFSLADFEEQIMCVDGKIDRLRLPGEWTGDSSERESSDCDRAAALDELYATLLDLGRRFQDGEYAAVLESPTSRSIISGQTLRPGAGASAEVPPPEASESASLETAPVNDSDVNLMRRDGRVNVLVLSEASSLRILASRFIIHGAKSKPGSDSDSDEDEDDEDWLEEIELLEQHVRCMLVMLVGAAALNSFVQQNWTGPPQKFTDEAVWIGGENANTLGSNIVAERRQNIRLGLEVEGDCAFYKCEFPELLLISRALLSLVADADRGLCSAAWAYREDIQIDSTDFTGSDKDSSMLAKVCSERVTAPWWSARAVVIHHRTLISDVDGNVPLRKTADELFGKIRVRYSSDQLKSCSDDVAVAREESDAADADSKRALEQLELKHEMMQRLVAQAELEYGLTRHQWGAVDEAKTNFNAAKTATRLDTHITGFRGRKTKYQLHDTQHLVVVATSALGEVHEKYVIPTENAPEPLPLLPEEREAMVPKEEEAALGMPGNNDIEAEANAGNKSTDASTPAEGDDDDNDDDEEDHPEQTAAITSSGTVAYTLDEVDPDNIVLENIRFTDENYDQGGNLTLFDQCIILAQCLDVKNSNSKHGLTNIEMMPYVTRVMETSQHSNWMVHTSALLVRAWLEFEVWRTKTRAMMQLQALVDQHVNRLSAGQRAGTDVYAPAVQRMRYVYVLPLQSYWEMRGDLADRYMALHIKHSALQLYTDLERWEQIVQCYLDLEEDKKALSLVKERLLVRPSPMLYCCLGELEDNDDHFRTAWKFSGNRYARALRLLAQRRHRAGDSDGALENYMESTSASPNNHACWWRIGDLAMRKERWHLSAKAWKNVARLAPEDGEARANLGAVFTRLDMWEQAYRAFDMASQLEYRNWKVWENKLFAAARTQRIAEAILAQRRVVDLRGKRKDHKMNWRVATIITNVVVESMRQVAKQTEAKQPSDTNGVDAKNAAASSSKEGEWMDASLDNVVPDGDEVDDGFDKEDANTDGEDGGGSVDENFYRDSDGLPAARHGQRLRLMFEHAASIVEQDPDFWGLYQKLEDAFGNAAKALDCCERRFRALERGKWEESEIATGRIADAVEDLVKRYGACGQKAKGEFMIKAVVDRLQKRSDRVAEAAENVEEKWREEVICRLQNRQ